jgi:hypothetical protein
MPDVRTPAVADPDTASTAELIRKALDDVQELAKAEVALAGKELGAEATSTFVTAIAMSVSIAVGVCAVATGVAALIVGLGGTTVAALASAAAILAIATAIGIVTSIARSPKGFLPRTRQRVAEDISEMKDHFA